MYLLGVGLYFIQLGGCKNEARSYWLARRLYVALCGVVCDGSDPGGGCL